MSVYVVFIHINPHMGLFYPIKLPPIYQKIIHLPTDDYEATICLLTRQVAFGSGFAAVRPGRTVHAEGSQLKNLFVSILIAYGVTITFLHAVAFNVHKIQYWQYFKLFELSQSSLHIYLPGVRIQIRMDPPILNPLGSTQWNLPQWGLTWIYFISLKD